MEEIQSIEAENAQAGAIPNKQQTEAHSSKVPLKDSTNSNATKDSKEESPKKQIPPAKKVEVFDCAKNGFCYCNGSNRRSIESNFYDLTPSAEFLHVLDFTSNPSKMFHLMMSDPNYGALFNEKDPMEELREPFELPPLSKSPKAEAEYFDKFPEVPASTAYLNDDFDVPFPEYSDEEEDITREE